MMHRLYVSCTLMFFWSCIFIIYHAVAEFLQNLIFGLVHFPGLVLRRIVESEVVQQAVRDVQGQFGFA